jgi:alpha-tubulin suppressor-like RCC1 family protein
VKLFSTLIATLLLAHSCATNDHMQKSVSTRVAGAFIYEPDGLRPAGNATIKVFDAASIDSCPVASLITDECGCYSLAGIPSGLYCIWGQRDSLGFFQDSVLLTPTFTTLRDDTLGRECALTGIVVLEPMHDPRTVSIAVAGSGKRTTVADSGGNFSLQGLPRGTYSLLLSSCLPDYIPAEAAVTLPHAGCDTFRLAYSGIPVVSGIRISQDSSTRLIRVSWNGTAYKKIKDYAVFRGSCGGDTGKPLCFVNDTCIIDSSFRTIGPASDTAAACLAYRVGVRNAARQIGPLYYQGLTRLLPSSRLATTVTQRVVYPIDGHDSASIGDTIAIVLSAVNPTRPLKRLAWFEAGEPDPMSIAEAVGPLDLSISDTLWYCTDSAGAHRIVAVVSDRTGLERIDTICIKIVRDAPVACAGNDTLIGAGDTVRLHGSARQEFGTIRGWEWKIGSAGWSASGTPDTVFIPLIEEAMLRCSLAVIDDDGNRSIDGLNIFMKVRDVATNQTHSMILKTDGSLWTCGNNDDGELGDNSDTLKSSPTRIMTGVTAVSAGVYHSLILKTDETLWACGKNCFGQLGDGTTTGRRSPVRVFNDVKSMTAGADYSLIITTDGTLWACGHNESGQLGDGTRTDRVFPVKITGEVKAVSASSYTDLLSETEDWSYTMILKNDESLWTCGSAYIEQLRKDTSTDRLSPVSIITGVKAMAAGELHALILKTDGTLWAYGKNGAGQLGDGTTAGRQEPVHIMTGAQSMAVGRSHSLIVKTDGTLWACGDNYFGQLGDGTNTDRSSPVPILAGVRSVAAAAYHSLILKTDGSLWVCGFNSFYQLGEVFGLELCTPKRIIPPAEQK